MIIPRNNPVGRLYFILKDASRRNKNEAASFIWADVFGLERSQRLEVLACLGRLSDLVVEARDCARDLAVEEAADGQIDETFFSCFANVTELLVRQDLTVQWQKSLALLNENTLLGLCFWATKLESASDEAEIEAEHITALMQDVTEFAEAVSSSELSDDVKAFVIRSLEVIRIGLIEYRIRGPKPLQDALEITIGGIFRICPQYKAEQDRNADTLKKFESILANLDRLVQTSRKGIKLLKGVASLVLPFLKESA